jgi:hypothetical protein
MIPPIITKVALAAALAALPSAALPPARSVSGVVLDTQGRPLAGAQVRVRADFVYGRAEATTGTDGRYLVRDLLRATYRVEAFIQREYNGGTVCPRLAMASPSDYNSFDVGAGAVRNFRWQLSGRVGLTDSNFGADMMVWWEGSPPSDARAVEFTFTPDGPLIDGSKASTVVREWPVGRRVGDGNVHDVPLGRYRLTAVAVSRAGTRTPITISTTADMTFKREVDVVWEPERFCGMGSDSGVQAFFVRIAAKS